jgi:lysylphosphatidylglycerol synthetase-like protein (DUF2156 family)
MGPANPLLIGTGMVALDIAVAALATVAALIQYWRIASWRSSTLAYIGRWLVALGWTTLAGRVWQTLYTVGDILISLPSLVSLIMIAAGSIIVQLFWHPESEHPR